MAKRKTRLTLCYVCAAWTGHPGKYSFGSGCINS